MPCNIDVTFDNQFDLAFYLTSNISDMSAVHEIYIGEFCERVQ